MSNNNNFKNDLKNTQYTIYNKMSNASKPFNCAKCSKGSYTSICVSCMKDINCNQKKIISEDKNIVINKSKKMKIEDILKIKLRANDKRPIGFKDWTKRQNQSKSYKAEKNANIGIVCSKESGVIAIDLDFYTKDESKPYDPINNPKHKEFIDRFGENYIERFNTYTQKTGNGGIHLLFKHDDDIIQTQNEEYKIDTRGGNTNGYIVGLNSVVNGKKYEVKLDTDIKPIPADLKQFLIEKVFTSSQKSVSKKTTKKGTKIIADKTLTTQYKYDLTDDQLRIILDNLSSDYLNGFDKWFIFTSAMKQIGRKDLWEEYSKKGDNYDEIKNECYWNSANNKDEECVYFEHILSVTENYKYVNLSKYRPIPTKQSKPDEIIDMPYLTGDKTDTEGVGYENGLNYYNDYDMIIQSDTGTGKTSSFVEYIKNSNNQFIAIVSRRILAMEQYETFCDKLDGVIEYYEHGQPQPYNEGFVCCLDSILKLQNWTNEDLSKKVVFLDEFNSLIEYIMTTPTMENKRVLVFKMLVKRIFMYAKKIIMADADISDISMRFIQYIKELRKEQEINKEIKYIQNVHIHNKDTPATQYFSKIDLLEKAKKSKSFIFACDSKREAIDIYKQLDGDKNKIKLIVARDDTRNSDEEYIKLDEHDKIIFSPKIVYGNDSVFNGGRDVFCYYREKTISVPQMFQQINRERKINHLHYCFEEQEFSQFPYEKPTDILDEIKDTHKYALEMFGDNGDDYLENMFIDIHYNLIEKLASYETNKGVHFHKILPTRGFVRTNDCKKKTKKQSKKQTVEAKIRVSKWKKENFVLSDALNSRLNQDILRIHDTRQLRKYKHLFTDTNAVSSYLLTHYYLNATDMKKLCDKMNDIQDFPHKKVENGYNKVFMVRDWVDTFGYNIKLEKKKESTITKEQSDNINKDFKKIFRSKKEIDFVNADDYTIKQFLVQVVNHACDMKLFVGKKQRDKQTKKVVTNYSMDKDIVEMIDTITTTNKTNKKISRERRREIDYYKNNDLLNEISNVVPDL